MVPMLSLLSILGVILVFRAAPIQAQNGTVCATAAWNNTIRNVVGISGSASSAANYLYYPYDVFVDRSQALFVADCSSNRVKKFLNGSTVSTTVSGLTLSCPSGIFVTSDGMLYVIDYNNYRIQRWNSGIVTVVAGGHGNGAALTQMSGSYGLSVDSNYNIYISEYSNCRVTRWANGNTTAGGVVAGGNGCGSAPNQLKYPWGIYLNGNKTLFIADYSNHRIQRWVSGAITGVTVAGESGVAGSLSYQLSSPTSITFDQYDNMYVLDTGNNRIQRWASSAIYGITIASGSMNTPYGLKLDFAGNLYVADYNNHRIGSFKMNCPTATTTTTTIASSTQPINRVCATSYWNATFSTVAGTSGSSGSTATLLSSPNNIFLDGLNRTYVVDTGNNRIQRFSSGSSTGTTVAGWYTTAGSTIGQFNAPTAVYVDVNGSIYVLDSSNYRVMLFINNDDDTMGSYEFLHL